MRNPGSHFKAAALLTALAIVGSGAAVTAQDEESKTIGFVPPGRYVVAYTCDADDSEIDADVLPTPPAVGESVTFVPVNGTTIDVAANQTVTVDFAVAPPT